MLFGWSQEFPMTSKLDPAQFGDALSAITAKHIQDRLEGLTVDQVSVNIRESPKQVVSCLLSIDIQIQIHEIISI